MRAVLAQLVGPICVLLVLAGAPLKAQVPDATDDMVLIPAGPFIQGSDHPQAAPDERPARRLELPAFWLDQREVTNAQFAAFVADTQYRTEAEAPGEVEQLDDISWRQPEGPGTEPPPDHPVVYVSWADARSYCTWRGKRLPTEAEWEKAARGADGRIWPWGNEATPARANIWGATDPFSSTAPVGALPEGASPYGLQDMAGNVWEWCADWYDETSASPADTSAPRLKVVRGGSWINPLHTARTTNRFEIIPQERSAYVGFRCARD